MPLPALSQFRQRLSPFGIARSSRHAGMASSFPPRHHSHSLHTADHDPILIDPLNRGENDPPVRLRPRRPSLGSGNPNRQPVPRPHRTIPPQFIHTRRRQTGHCGQIIIHKRPHHHGSRMPSAGNQPMKWTRRRSHRIDMHSLWIVPLRKRNHLRLVDGNRPIFEDRANRIVFEVTILFRWQRYSPVSL